VTNERQLLQNIKNTTASSTYRKRMPLFEPYITLVNYTKNLKMMMKQGNKNFGLATLNMEVNPIKLKLI
jgi:hypothetical protein